MRAALHASLRCARSAGRAIRQTIRQTVSWGNRQTGRQASGPVFQMRSK